MPDHPLDALPYWCETCEQQQLIPYPIVGLPRCNACGREVIEDLGVPGTRGSLFDRLRRIIRGER